MDGFQWLLSVAQKKRHKIIHFNRSTCGFVLFPTCLTTGWFVSMLPAALGCEVELLIGQHSSFCDELRGMCSLAMSTNVILDLGNLIRPCQSTGSRIPCQWLPFQGPQPEMARQTALRWHITDRYEC